MEHISTKNYKFYKSILLHIANRQRSNKFFVSAMAMILMAFSSKAQTRILDSTVNFTRVAQNSFHFKEIIVPGALMSYGLIGLNSMKLKELNYQIREKVVEQHNNKIKIDNFLQFTPVVAVYSLNLAGVKGKHNFIDRSVIIGTSYLLMGSTVLGLKSISNIERPDHSTFNSFPSGHTATAFAGAEFMWQEYKDVSVWYGISAYVVASGTGVLRMYNNRHWLTDVAMGAGLGILSTKVAYWIGPYMKKHLFKRRK